jgi:hypothetical protein
MVKTGLGCAHRDAEDVGDLGELAALEMAENEQCTLLGSKTAEAALELIPIGDVDEIVARGRNLEGQDAKVQDSASLMGCLRETRAHDQAVKPGVESVRVAESGQVAPGGHQRVLDGILGPIDVAEDPLSDGVETVAADPDQIGKRLLITIPCRLDEIPFHRPQLR